MGITRIGPEVQSAVASCTRVVSYQEPPPSLELKRYFKDDSQIPSPEEVGRLAKDAYLDDSGEGRAGRRQLGRPRSQLVRFEANSGTT